MRNCADAFRKLFQSLARGGDFGAQLFDEDAVARFIFGRIQSGPSSGEPVFKLLSKSCRIFKRGRQVILMQGQSGNLPQWHKLWQKPWQIIPNQRNDGVHASTCFMEPPCGFIVRRLFVIWNVLKNGQLSSLE